MATEEKKDDAVSIQDLTNEELFWFGLSTLMVKRDDLHQVVEQELERRRRTHG